MEVGAGPSMVNEEDDDELVELPPGFRFHPTDEEIIMHYLLHKIIDRRFVAKAIGEADLNKCEPWDLPSNLSPYLPWLLSIYIYIFSFFLFYMIYE